MGISLSQLTNAISQVKTYCVNKFTHDNIDVLEKLSESDDGKILYNNKEIDATEQVASIKKYQKYLNTELDYYYGEMIETNSLNYSISNLPIKLIYKTKEYNNIDYDESTGFFSLKANKTYSVFADMRNSTTNGSSFQITYGAFDEKDNMLSGYAISISPNYVYSWNDKKCNFILTPTEDINIYFKIFGANLDTNDTISSIQANITIQEIGRQITIDPLEYVNESQGLEDTPVGHIISHMGTIAPKHYLICDGSEYNISDYPYLTQHMIDNFGSVNYFGGDGVTTFAVPDLIDSDINWYNINIENYTISASSIYGTGYEASLAIDNNTETIWESEKDGVAPAWWMIESKNKMLISAIKIYQSTYIAKDFIIQGSDDGINFTDLYNVTEADNSNQWVIYNFKKIYNYKYYRIYCKTSYYDKWFVAQIGEIQFGVYKKLNCIKYEPTYFMVKNNTNYLQPTLYSEEERIIGSWIDGKPLYEKVFTNLYTGNVTASTYVEINDILFNIDKIINIACTTIGNNGNNQEQNWYLKARYGTTINGLMLYGSANYDKVISVNAIVQYTKTTDAKNSFTQNMITDFIIQGSEEVLTQEQIQVAIDEDIF